MAMAVIMFYSIVQGTWRGGCSMAGKKSPLSSGMRYVVGMFVQQHHIQNSHCLAIQVIEEIYYKMESDDCFKLCGDVSDKRASLSRNLISLARLYGFVTKFIQRYTLHLIYNYVNGQKVQSNIPPLTG